jgi:hypothetical protein
MMEWFSWQASIEQSKPSLHFLNRHIRSLESRRRCPGRSLLSDVNIQNPTDECKREAWPLDASCCKDLLLMSFPEVGSIKVNVSNILIWLSMDANSRKEIKQVQTSDSLRNNFVRCQWFHIGKLGVV